MDIPCAVHGTKLEIRGKTVNGPAMAHSLPFDDPDKKKRTAA
jgi:aminomethyltransferase